MIFESYKVKFYREQLAIAKEENRMLLCALLAASGRSDAANMLKPKPVESEPVQIVAGGSISEAVFPKPTSRGWRGVAKFWSAKLNQPEESDVQKQ